MLTSQFHIKRFDLACGLHTRACIRFTWGTSFGTSPRGKGLKQDYFIVVLAHSLHGRLQRVHIPHRFIYSALGASAFLLLMMFGVVGSYARMA